MQMESELRLHPIEIAGRIGFVDNEGRVVIPPTFMYASDFGPEGLAVASIVNPDKNRPDPDADLELYGYIDPTGEFVVPPEFPMAEPFSEGYALLLSRSGWGYLDRRGKWAIPPDSSLEDARGFYEGFASVQRDSVWTLIDRDRQDLFGRTFLRPAYFSQGLAIVTPRENVWQVIDPAGKIRFQLKDIQPHSRTYSEGLADVVSSSDERVFGFMDQAGHLAIPTVYRAAEPFSQGLAAVQVDDGRWGFISRENDWVIPPRYLRAYSFEYDFAAVSNGDKWGFIDATGQLVIPFQFDSAISFRRNVAVVRMNGKNVLIDREGQVIGPKL